MTANIELTQMAFQPGDIIAGRVTWSANEAPEGAVLRLFWYTEGRGDRDTAIQESVVFNLPQASDSRDFRFHAPQGPLSFAGTLFSVRWGLELILNAEASAMTSLTIGPAGRELTLKNENWIQTPEPQIAESFFKRLRKITPQ